MAWVVRIGALRPPICSSVERLCKATTGSSGHVTKVQMAFISSRAMRITERQRPEPFPYKEKRFTLWNQFFDNTVHRFDDNSKIIVVEGPIAAGKTKLAQHLAKELDMLYMPAATMDLEYINEYGFDLRTLDPKLPLSCQSYDEKKFCETPRHLNTANFQIKLYLQRHSQYIDALAHLFSTGEGVVLERSPFSDIVFLETMYKAGYISKEARAIYHDVRKSTQCQIMKPHLVIYLDVPAEQVKKNIIKRGIPHEVNSEVFTAQYLSDMETLYKQEWLKDIALYSHMLIYDWTEPGDAEVVVEDIERLDFDTIEQYQVRLGDWRIGHDEWADYRRLFADEKDDLMQAAEVVRVDVPELLVDGGDIHEYMQVIKNAPGEEYMKGFNPDLGDTGLLWKWSVHDRNYRSKNFW